MKGRFDIQAGSVVTEGIRERLASATNAEVTLKSEENGILEVYGTSQQADKVVEQLRKLGYATAKRRIRPKKPKSNVPSEDL